ncbi:MAG: conjugative transfer ATPase [Moritella sp.]|uniref:conjugative transfer ATPase n=1 Tax=Moritella sp. TaxID=78556 RepID=UPI001DED9758|nr:conjugative transfer ATPase [Moritella sp.]NQZ49360.1 conjugative transfer ATPase [Moritella sp.]
MLDTTSLLDKLKTQVRQALETTKRDNARIDRAVTEKQMEALYETNKQSFIDFLPWMEYLNESEQFLLEDCYSVAAVYTIRPIATEGVSEDDLILKRDALQDMFQDIFKPGMGGDWVIQQYSYADTQLQEYMEEIKESISPIARGTQFTEEYLRVMEGFYRGTGANEKGIFEDTLVTNSMFRGHLRQCKLVFYRRCSKTLQRDPEHNAQSELNEICDRLETQLKSNNIKFQRDNGKRFFRWMLDWLNPKPTFGESKEDFLNMMSFPETKEETPYGYDLSEQLLFNKPVSVPEKGVWEFDEMPHRFVRARSIRRSPELGQLSGEVKRSEQGFSQCFLDGLPPGSVVCQSFVISFQSDIEKHLNKIESASKGDSSESEATLESVSVAKAFMGSNQHICNGSFGVYIRANDYKELKRYTNDVYSSMASNSIVPYDAAGDSLATNAYLVHLPMMLNSTLATKKKYLKPYWVQHMMNMSLMFGRSTGSGNALVNLFNRGGSPLSFDFMNKDKSSNSHMLVLGPTGSGKSVSLVNLIFQLMGALRPKMFIFEVGNSFGLLADYCKANGLTVSKKKIIPGGGVTLNPYADSHKLYEPVIEVVNEEDDDGDDQRDIAGEMLIAALLMITGGEQKEYDLYTKADKSLVNRAIREAGQIAYDTDYELLAEHIRDRLNIISKDSDLDTEMQIKAKRMAISMDSFCHGFDGETFNTPSGGWEDADITLIDIATYSRKGYEGQLALTYISLMNHINGMGEKMQHDPSGRQIISITDEAHVITTNPMLAPFLVTAVKVQRKLGISSILATQNLTDYPNAAEKLLKMIDWWMCLCPTSKEVEEITKFKPLTATQEKMMLSCKQLPKRYTEGMILSNSLPEMLFRTIPPSLILALALNEKDEKADRAVLMRNHKITEVQAAYMIAEELDRLRGITA